MLKTDDNIYLRASQTLLWLLVWTYFQGQPILSFCHFPAHQIQPNFRASIRIVRSQQNLLVQSHKSEFFFICQMKGFAIFLKKRSASLYSSSRLKPERCSRLSTAASPRVPLLFWAPRSRAASSELGLSISLSMDTCE